MNMKIFSLLAYLIVPAVFIFGVVGGMFYSQQLLQNECNQFIIDNYADKGYKAESLFGNYPSINESLIREHELNPLNLSYIN